MRITVIGTGNVGATLGKGWAEVGHQVTFGTRDPSSDKVQQLLSSLGGKARAAATKEAVQVAVWSGGARVVKIFNTTGSDNMASPHYGEQAATMFYAGDDAEANQIAAQLARDLGFEPVDAGPLANARLLEPLAALWIYLAYPGGQGRRIAFKLLR